MTQTRNTTKTATTRMLLASRCSKCNEAVSFAGYKALNAFRNTGRVCDACITKALAEDMFSRIEKSIEAQDAFARKFGE